MNEPAKPDKPLRDYATYRTVIRGPHIESDQTKVEWREWSEDERLRLDIQEAERTNRLIKMVLWTMTAIICAFVVWSSL